MHLYAYKRQQNTPHGYFFFGCYYRILLLPFSVFYVYIWDGILFFLFPDTCVLRFILYAYSYTIHCFHGFYTPSLVKFLSFFFIWIHGKFDLFLIFIHYNNRTLLLVNGSCFVSLKKNFVVFFHLQICQWIHENITQISHTNP